MYCRKLEFCRAAWSNKSCGRLSSLVDRRLPVRLGTLESGPGVVVAKNQQADRLGRWLSEKTLRNVRSCIIGTLPFSNATRPLKMAGRLSHFLAFCQWLTLEFRGVQVGHVCSLKPRNWTLCEVSQFHFEFADHDSSFWTAYIAVVCEGRQALEWKCL